MKSLLRDPFFIVAVSYVIFFFVSRFYRRFKKKNPGPSTFKVRWHSAWKILTGKHHRWIVISVSNEALARACSGYPFEYNIEWCGLDDYPRYFIIKQVANLKTDIDMVILKGQYEAAVEEFMMRDANKKNEKNAPQ